MDLVCKWIENMCWHKYSTWDESKTNKSNIQYFEVWDLVDSGIRRTHSEAKISQRKWWSQKKVLHASLIFSVVSSSYSHGTKTLWASFKYFIVVFWAQNLTAVQQFLFFDINASPCINLFLDSDSFYNCIPHFSSERSN